MGAHKEKGRSGEKRAADHKARHKRQLATNKALAEAALTFDERIDALQKALKDQLEVNEDLQKVIAHIYSILSRKEVQSLSQTVAQLDYLRKLAMPIHSNSRQNVLSRIQKFLDSFDRSLHQQEAH